MSDKRKTVAIFQARLGSSRLPGKTLIDIDGKPMLTHIIERVQHCIKIDDIVIATTTEPEELAIRKLAEDCGVKVFSGSKTDVLDRFYQTAKIVNADVIVRITADDPFKDPQIIDQFVTCFQENLEFDFVGEEENNPTFPEGLAVSVFSFQALERAWREAELSSEREHVIPYILKNPHKFNIGVKQNSKDLSHYRWTVDYEEDIQFTREVYKRLNQKEIFLMQDILDLLDREPWLKTINQGIARNEGYKKSLQNDHVINPQEVAQV